jgi:hypothetical protein
MIHQPLSSPLIIDAEIPAYAGTTDKHARCINSVGSFLYLSASERIKRRRLSRR